MEQGHKKKSASILPHIHSFERTEKKRTPPPFIQQEQHQKAYLHDLFAPLHIGSLLELVLPRRLASGLQETSTLGTQTNRFNRSKDILKTLASATAHDVDNVSGVCRQLFDDL